MFMIDIFYRITVDDIHFVNSSSLSLLVSRWPLLVSSTLHSIDIIAFEMSITKSIINEM